MTFGLSYRRMRWVISAWLTLSTVLNLIDRQTLSILAPLLRDKFNLSTQEYSHIVTAFMISFTVMYTVGGRFVDWIGERLDRKSTRLNSSHHGWDKRSRMPSSA
jgi:ACS family hexuronate transporter-like MFS transporter